MGLEATMPEYINRLLVVFDEVLRVLRSDGTCWVNLGDTYAGYSSYNPRSKQTYDPANPTRARSGRHSARKA